MSLSVTLFIQVILAIAGGISASAALVLRNRLKRDVNLVYQSILFVFFIFWGINAARCALLTGGEMLAYDSDSYLLVLDIAVAGGISLFYYFTSNDIMDCKSRKYTNEAVCGALFGIMAVWLIKLVMQNKNLNAALYSILKPQNIFAIGVIGIIVYCALGCLRNGIRRHKPELSEAAVAMLLSITFFIFPAFETFMANAEEFQFTVGQVWRRLICFGIFLVIIVLIVMLMLPEKKRKAVCYAAWAFSLSAYFQGMFLNGRLFLMDGKRLEWEDRLKIVNLIIWFLVIAALIVFCMRVKNAGKIITYVSLALCAMQIIGCVSLIPSYLGKSMSSEALYKDYFSEKGFNEVASDENVLVFVLDTYDVDFLDEVLGQEPDFLAPLKDFIYFPDNVSQFSRTFPSIPYMLTEELYFYDEPFMEYADKAFAKCEFWENLKQSGYSYYIYEEDEHIIGNTVREEAGNFVREGHVIEEKISFLGCAKSMVEIGGYRLLPYAFKEYYIYTEDDIDDMVIGRKILDFPSYEGEDADLYRQLRENGLEIGSDSKAFRFIHTKGAHAPYTMNAEGEKIKNGECSPVEQYMGCMRFVYDYIEELKRLGVYDKTTIVITADHGENYVMEELEQAVNPILFIKRGGDINETMRTSDVCASQNDLLPTLASVMGIGYDKSWGLDLLNAAGKDKERERYHYYSVVEGGIQTKAKVYKIVGNSRDFSNWEATGEYREFGEFY